MMTHTTVNQQLERLPACALSYGPLLARSQTLIRKPVVVYDLICIWRLQLGNQLRIDVHANIMPRLVLFWTQSLVRGGEERAQEASAIIGQLHDARIR